MTRLDYVLESWTWRSQTGQNGNDITFSLTDWLFGDFALSRTIWQGIVKGGREEGRDDLWTHRVIPFDWWLMLNLVTLSARLARVPNSNKESAAINNALPLIRWLLDWGGKKTKKKQQKKALYRSINQSTQWTNGIGESLKECRFSWFKIGFKKGDVFCLSIPSPFKDWVVRRSNLTTNNY